MNIFNSKYWQKLNQYHQQYWDLKSLSVLVGIKTLVLSWHLFFIFDISILSSVFLALSFSLTWDLIAKKIFSYHISPNYNSGWSYVNRQDVAMEIEYLAQLIAQRNSSYTWLLLVIPSPMAIMATLGVELVFMYINQAQILSSHKFYEFSLKPSKFISRNLEFEQWLVLDSFNQADRKYQQQYPDHELKKYNYQSSLRNCFVLNQPQINIHLPVQDQSGLIAIAPYGDKLTHQASSVKIFVDEQVFIDKNAQALEDDWNEFELPAGKEMRVEIQGDPRSFLLEAPRFNQSNSRAQTTILIICDALTKNDLKLFHEDGVETPHLRRYFANSKLFDQVMVQGEWTTTNFAHMFSGLYSSQHNATHRYEGLKNEIAQDHKMMAEYFQDENYHTAMFSCSKRLSASKGYARGFDEVYVRDYQTVQNHELTYKAIDWLDRNKHQNNFIVLHFMDTHGPFNFWSHYKELDLEQSPKKISDVWRRSDPNLFDRVYQNQVKEFDLGMGIFFSYLENHPSYQEVNILLSSDHGQMHNIPDWDPMKEIEPLFSYRMLNVPVFIRSPQIQAFSKSTQLIEAGVDLLPTILDLAKIPHKNLQGKSYLEDTEGKDFAVSESFYEGVVQRRIESPTHLYYKRFHWQGKEEGVVKVWFKESAEKFIELTNDELNMQLSKFTEFEKQQNLVSEDSNPEDYYGNFQ